MMGSHPIFQRLYIRNVPLQRQLGGFSPPETTTAALWQRRLDKLRMLYGSVVAQKPLHPGGKFKI